MIKKELNLNKAEVSDLKIYLNEGDFRNDEGREIHYSNYSGTLRVCGEKVKFRVERASKEDLDEIVEKNNLLD